MADVSIPDVVRRDVRNEDGIWWRRRDEYGRT